LVTLTGGLQPFPLLIETLYSAHPGVLTIRLAEDEFTVESTTFAVGAPAQTGTFTPYRVEGELIDFFETGCEGAIWSIEDDSRFGRGAMETNRMPSIANGTRGTWRSCGHWFQPWIDLTASSLVAFLGLGRPGMKTYNNRRGILSTFLKFSFQRGWIAENPIPKVPHYRIRRKRGVAQTFTVPQARTLREG
jgi:hypothetical protein